jgi:hypothetical protein
MNVLYLFIYLNFYCFKKIFSFVNIIYNFIKILKLIRDYIIIFFFKNINLITLIMYLNIIKIPLKKVKIKKGKKKDLIKINKNKEIVKNILNKISSINSKKYMYYGLFSVYISIFFRLIKENKNHAIYIYKYKFKNYIVFNKNYINNFFIFLFYLINYNLLINRINLIKKLYYIYIFIKLILLKKVVKLLRIKFSTKIRR